MSVSISLPDEIEQALLLRAKAAGQDINAFVTSIVTEQLADESGTDKNESHEEFMTKLRGIISLHPVSNGNVDDSRESIYAGCGE